MTLLETAGAGDAKGERRGADSTERVGEVVRNRPLDLADEPKGEVQLLVVLPAEVGAVVHRVDEEVADRLGWADGDEEAVQASDPVTYGREPAPRWDRGVGRQIVELELAHRFDLQRPGRRPVADVLDDDERGEV